MRSQNYRAFILLCVLVLIGLSKPLSAIATTGLEAFTDEPAAADSESGTVEREQSVQLPSEKPTAWADGPEATRPLIDDSSMGGRTLAIGVVVFVIAAFAFKKLAPKFGEILNSHFNPWETTESAATQLSANVVAEQQAFEEFSNRFQTSLRDHKPNPEPSPASTRTQARPRPEERLMPASEPAVEPISKPKASAPKPQRRQKQVSEPVAEFLLNATADLGAVRNLFREIGRANDQALQQERLKQIYERVGAFKDKANLPELLPVWQLSVALEGLLKQLADRTSNVTPSTLRTAAGAVDLLEALCVPGLDSNLASDPPIRMLAVDDDLVSRQAICLALARALQVPDLANDGTDGLALASRNAYDVIFLDVEMPGLDGFELCGVIRETATNKTTPIVFVTNHSDFNARAKSTLKGAQDLIGKPFLAFEITVKALTLVLRSRLDRSRASEANADSVKVPASRTAEPSSRVVKDAAGAAVMKPEPPTPATSGPKSDDGAQSPGQKQGTLRERLAAILESPEPEQVKIFLGNVQTAAHKVATEAERAELRSAGRLGHALEGMLQKLFEKPKNCTSSCLNSAVDAMELLEQLCNNRTEVDLSEPPVRLLVVDDDPISRRAVSGALQVGFARAENADSGEAAVALAEERAFDLIFMDVIMPGTDGFAACSSIRETSLNRNTPIVFVTTHNDENARRQAEAVGGNGFIPKPVVPSEILLTALTFTIRSRLEQGAEQKSDAAEAVVA